MRHRRIDPVRLVEEFLDHPEWLVSESEGGWREIRYPGSEFIVRLWIDEGKLYSLVTFVDLPLRGRVPVRWEWAWVPSREPSLSIYLDGEGCQ